MLLKTAILAFAIAAPALAQTAQTAPASAAAKPADKPVCRSEQQTGSILPGKRICHTKAEWHAIDEANASAISASHENRNFGSGQN